MQGFLFELDTGARTGIRAVVALIGFWTAWRAGKAAAESWSNYPLVIVYTFLLSWVMQFMHHALFNGPLLSLSYFLIDLVLLLVVSTAGFRYRRTAQMVNNYYWLFRRTSPFTWSVHKAPGEQD